MNLDTTISRLVQQARESHEYHKHAISRLKSLKGKLSEADSAEVLTRHLIGSAIAQVEIELLTKGGQVEKVQRLVVALALLREAAVKQERIVRLLSDKSESQDKIARITLGLRDEITTSISDAVALASIEDVLSDRIE